MRLSVRLSILGYLGRLNNGRVEKVLVLPGDNIGPEIIAEAVRVLETVNEKFGLGIELDYAHLGGAASGCGG